MLHHDITSACAISGSASSLALDSPSQEEAPIMKMIFPVSNVAMLLEPNGKCMNCLPSLADRYTKYAASMAIVRIAKR
eukprot:8768668-Ditylum_brightwellii.AAC.1